MEATIKTLATKDDLYNTKEELHREFGNARKEISESKAHMIKWMFIFWIGQIGATLAILLLFVRK